MMGQVAGQSPIMLGRHMLPMSQPSGPGGLGQVMLSAGQAVGGTTGQFAPGGGGAARADAARTRERSMFGNV